MATHFVFDESVFIEMAKLYRKSPKTFRVVTSDVLNRLAFDTRTEAIDTITSKMISRRPSFTRRQMRVDKSSKGDIRSQRAIVGSIPKGSFTGWEEQEYGGDKRKHYATKSGRRGTYENIIPPSHRLRVGMTFPTMEDYDVNRVAAFLAILQRQGYKKPFKITKGRKFKKGIYKFKGRGKVTQIQSLEPPKKTKRLPWMTIARDHVVKTNPVKNIWEEALRFRLNPKRRR